MSADQLTDDLLREIRENDPALTRLDLIGWRGRRLNDDDLVALSSALDTNHTIWYLNVAGNRFGIAGMRALATMLQRNRTISKLSLDSNTIGGAPGAQALATAMETNHAIVFIGMNHCKVGDEGVRAFAVVCQTNTTLTRINLVDNNISDDGARVLATALPRTNLQFIGLAHNDISYAGSFAFANAFEENQTMTTRVVLDNNERDAAGPRQIMELFRYLNSRNRRRILQTDLNPSSWPLILARGNARYANDTVFYYLREKGGEFLLHRQEAQQG